MAREFVRLFSLLFLATLICSGSSFDVQNETENDLCNCEQAIYDLVEFVKELDKRLKVASTEIVRLVKLHSTFNLFQRENAVEHKKIFAQIGELSKRRSSYDNPTSEALVLKPETDSLTTSSTMADGAEKMKNFTVLIEEVNDKFKEVKSLSSEVTELQADNKVLKAEMEKERRVRRSLQDQVSFVEEGLNMTQSWVLEINEKVKNSSTDEVAEIVFAKIAEFDALNKTAIENQLKKLEYKVKDVFKNETELVRRLDSVENVSTHTAGLLENGTLLDNMRNVANTIQILEKIQSQQNSAMNQLEHQVNNVNDSLVQKIKQVENAVSTIELSTNETMLSFENELLKMNDTWNNKSIAIDKAFSSVDEKIAVSNNEMGNVINTTKDIDAFLTAVYREALNNISMVQEKVEKTQVRMEELALISDQLKENNDILNRTIDKDEFYELQKNLSVQNRLMQEKALAFYTNGTELISKTSEKIAEVEKKYVITNELMKQYVNNSSLEKKLEEERIQNLSTEFHNLKWNQSAVLNLLESRIDNLALQAEEMALQNLTIRSIVHNLNELRDLQLESENTISTTIGVMEELLMQKIEVYREETMHLIEKLEESVNYTRQGKDLPNEDESHISRIRINVEETPSEETTNDHLPCLYQPFRKDDFLTIAYLHEALYEELSEETWVPSGDHLLFGCKKIGRFVLIGSDIITCINGQWDNKFPSCEKLVEEAAIKEAIGVQSDPCLQSSGQFPDPTDCTKFYNCWNDHKMRQSCPSGLHFSAKLKRCDYPKTANCDLNNMKGKLGHLLDIIPPINFSPLGVDSANSLLATSVTGELVVYPGSTVNMLCMYPRELGEPHWEVEEKVFHPHISAWDVRNNNELKNAYKLKLTIASATEDDSGNYTCITPRGRKHTIRILVTAVTCPEFDVDERSHLSVFYRPHPEGLQRVVTTQASFGCAQGYSLNGSNTATCTASETWSQDLPTCYKNEITGCVKPNLTVNPGLSMDPDKSKYDIGEMVYFECENQYNLLGVSTTRCSNGGTWTARILPHCVSHVG